VIQLKSADQIRRMRSAGLVVADALNAVREAVAAGATTADLDAVAAGVIRKAGATPSFLGYLGYPATICVSVNDEVVHGIPGPRVLAEGDIVSVDCGAIVDGWHGDAAFTVTVGQPTAADVALMAATEGALWAGLAASQVGMRMGDIGAAISGHVAAAGAYGILDGYVGHGIGTEMHMDPPVPNEGRAGKGLRLRAGMVIAIEPMITQGTGDSRVLADDWTVVTADGSRSAHFEHTVAITEAGPWVLTAPDGGSQRLADLGVACGAA